MMYPESTARSRKLLEVFLGIFCVLLIAFCITIQVVHTHDLAGNPHVDCALCLVAHLSVTFLAQLVLPTPQQLAVKAEVSHADSPRDSYVCFFYCRPPPVEPASV